jgi:hypothetical protein
VLPEGYALTESAPSSVDVTPIDTDAPGTPDGPPPARTVSLAPESFPLSVPIAFTGDEDEIRLSGTLYLCTEEDSGTCIFVDVNAIIPVVITPDGPPGRIEASLAPLIPDRP